MRVSLNEVEAISKDESINYKRVDNIMYDYIVSDREGIYSKVNSDTGVMVEAKPEDNGYIT